MISTGNDREMNRAKSINSDFERSSFMEEGAYNNIQFSKKPRGRCKCILKSVLFVFVLVVLLFLQGCITSSTGKRYYQMHLETLTGVPSIDATILVESVDVDEVYDDYRVVYRISPFELNYYSYEFWIKKPGQVVRDALRDYLHRSGIFRGVITKFKEGEPELMLKARVKVLEEHDLKKAWYAHLVMEIRVSLLKTGEELLVHSFDRRKKLSDKKVWMVPILISEILEEEMKIILTKLPSRLPQKK